MGDLPRSERVSEQEPFFLLGRGEAKGVSSDQEKRHSMGKDGLRVFLY